MANLDAWIAKQTADYQAANQGQLNALTSAYQANVAAENAGYNSGYEQARRQLNQISPGYDAERASADQAKNQALSWLPGQLANSGAAADSGANYAAHTSIGNSYLNAMNSIGQAQNSAVQKQRSALDTLRAQHQANLAKLGGSYQNDLADLRASQMKSILNQALTGYNAQASREEKAQEAADALAEKRRAAASSKTGKRA